MRKLRKGPIALAILGGIMLFGMIGRADELELGAQLPAVTS